MANTFTNIVLHLVFAVKNRESLIPTVRKPELYDYLTSCFGARGHHVIAIGGTPNHIHILFRYNPHELISDLVRDIKSASSVYIRKNRISPYIFNWQRGYGCFSADSGALDKIILYIHNQEEHHNQFQVKEEMRRLLLRCDMEFDNSYLFDDI